jgi:hypothetical protein
VKTKTFFQRRWREYTGSIHVHTGYSHDSDTPVGEILDAARRRRLDYLMITDHNTRDAARDLSANHTGVLAVLGVEVEDPTHNNHYLVFGGESIHTGIPAREYLEAYRREGATGFIAHPKELRMTNRYRKYEWTEPEVSEAAGLEIWNYVSHWLGHLHQKLNGLLLLWFPGWFVRKPLRSVLRMWDRLNQEGQRKTGIGSVDAHGMWHSLWGFRFRVLPHRYLFRTIRTNVLLPEETPLTEAAILEALRAGRCYVANYLLGDPDAFYAGICSESGKSAVYGEEIPFEPGLKLYFRLKRDAEVRLYGNGQRMAKQNTSLGWFPIDKPGFYRLEINRYRYGWIYTNPIYVTEPERNTNG